MLKSAQENFQDARWVSPPESMWRIYEFNLTEIQPVVINLQLHFLGKQAVYYWKKSNLQTIVQSDFVQQTMLTEYFKMCSINMEARTYLYRELPEHFVWNSQSKIWTKRKSHTIIGSINIANPREGERYYERLLLNHQCETFKEAIKERGLLESDNNISECLREMVTFKMPIIFKGAIPPQLRHNSNVP
ncbi:hypothetical protein H5410_046485 [Solanum commersonii]|uniref:Uncharacterized protein n=1 Tax=Solanum commersonii TaxID=4109 RepID=A0A9J5XCD3_SOLCO|nr:hypothetical protein H5410_046485 [Solanum commersonii]